jgi:dethiobiotin synthetase
MGTGTDVGKTWVGAALLEASLAAGMTVAARKPAQSFQPGNGPTDADVLAAASGEDPTVVCPAHRWYEVPYAPPMAADSLGRPEITLAELAEELEWPGHRVGLGLVEFAGGVASPIAHDGDPLDFVKMLRPDQVLLVADAGLGTINAVLLSLRSLARITSNESEDEGQGSIITVVNRFDPECELHQRNLEWLQKQGVNTVVGPIGDVARCGQNVFTNLSQRSQ